MNLNCFGVEANWMNLMCADYSEMSDVPTESNVQKDLNEWQEKHATLVLSKVKVSFVLERPHAIVEWIDHLKEIAISNLTHA